MKSIKRTVSLFAAVLLLALAACGCTDTTTATPQTTQAPAALSAEDYVQLVKESANSAYPDTTYGEAFEAFFTEPDWQYIKDSNMVEFSGKCLYSGEDVKACIQFCTSDGGKTFSPTAVSFSDVPQDSLTLTSLIEKAFTGDKETPAKQETKPAESKPSTGTSANTQTNTKTETASTSSSSSKGNLRAVFTELEDEVDEEYLPTICIYNDGTFKFTATYPEWSNTYRGTWKEDRSSDYICYTCTVKDCPEMDSPVFYLTFEEDGLVAEFASEAMIETYSPWGYTEDGDWFFVDFYD